RLLVDLCREEAPGLVVEHARTCGPVNDEPNPWQKTNPWVVHHSGRYAPWNDGAVLARAIELLRFSGTLRTYDVTFQLSVPTTLDRVAQLLAGKPADATSDGGLLLCEDEVYIGAGLGCAMGILRAPGWKTYAGQDYNPYHLDRRTTEAVRAVRWQRLAPAFAAWKAEVHLDSRVLMDDWRYEPGESAATWLDGQDIRQGAPARVARGMPLPAVHAAGEPPFVITSRHPNGAVSVATLPRTVRGRSLATPLADITMDIGAGDSPVGVFGQYGSLTLTLTEDLGARRIWAQDLAADAAVDITARVARQGRSLTLPGRLVTEAGTSAAEPGDLSGPGLVLRLI
ncbi:MAG TPA: hypothetical protein VKU44_12385, partial [Terriglobia bacterium]|nr:hypothetical protein [Terriglobia bacterium]